MISSPSVEFLGRTEVPVATIKKELENKGSSTRRLLLHEVPTGEVWVRLDLQLFWHPPFITAPQPQTHEIYACSWPNALNYCGKHYWMCEAWKEEIAFTTLPSFCVLMKWRGKEKGTFGKIPESFIAWLTTGCKDISGTLSFKFTVYCCTEIYISKLVTCLDLKWRFKLEESHQEHWNGGDFCPIGLICQFFTLTELIMHQSFYPPSKSFWSPCSLTCKELIFCWACCWFFS